MHKTITRDQNKFTQNIGLDRNKEIVYIGHGRLKERLRRHFTENIYKEVTYFRYEETFSKEKAKKREKALLSKFEKENKRLPKYNKRFG